MISIGNTTQSRMLGSRMISAILGRKAALFNQSLLYHERDRDTVYAFSKALKCRQ